MGTIDTSRDATPAPILQAQRLGQRFKFGPELAAEVAGLIYPARDDWRCRA